MKKYNAAQAWERWHKYQRYAGGDIFFKRRDFCLQFLASIKNQSHLRILDIGCGKGDTLHEIIESSDDLNSNSYEFYGIDITKRVLTLAKKRNPKANFICANAFGLPFKDRSIDVIMCTDLLHHLIGRSRAKSKSTVERAVKEMTRVSNEFIVIIEQCVKWRLSSYLVFLVTRFCSLLHVSFPYLGIQKEIVISFLTPAELYAMLRKSNIEIIVQGQDSQKGNFILSSLLRPTWVNLVGRIAKIRETSKIGGVA